jgi:hypothetical protein
MSMADELDVAIDQGIDAVRDVVNRGLQRTESYNTLYDMYDPLPPEDKDPNGDWAMTIAVQEKNAELALELFRAGADPDQFSPSHYPGDWPNCPYWFVRRGYELGDRVLTSECVPLIKAFLEFGWDPDFCLQCFSECGDDTDEVDVESRIACLQAFFEAVGCEKHHWARYYLNLRSVSGTSVATWVAKNHTQSSTSRLLVVFAALQFLRAAMRARKRAWEPGSKGFESRKRSFDLCANGQM